MSSMVVLMFVTEKQSTIHMAIVTPRRFINNDRVIKSWHVNVIAHSASLRTKSL